VATSHLVQSEREKGGRFREDLIHVEGERGRNILLLGYISRCSHWPEECKNTGPIRYISIATAQFWHSRTCTLRYIPQLTPKLFLVSCISI
jgi:hypothetical protein